MNKKLLVLIVLLITFIFNSYAQDAQCQNLEINEVPSTCVIPYTELVADFLDVNYKDTDTYAISSEPICQPETAQAQGVGIVADDDWSQVINLGFTFCYYGNMYDQIVVSDNGVVCFDLDEALQYHSWVIGTGITLPTPVWQQNSIFAPYVDTLTPADSTPTNAIRFDIINQDQSIPANVGNRRFIIEWDTPQYSCTTTYFKSRVVLYETSNVIDIMVTEKDVCTNWQAGRAVIGIQNKSATRGMSPLNRGADGAAWDPRRTGGPGTAIDQPDGELWRFIPDGDQLEYNFAWFEDTGNGVWNYVSGDPTINVAPDVTTSYKAELTFQGECTFTPSTIFEIIQVDPLQNVTNIELPDNLIACETTAGSGTAEFDLDQEAVLLAGFSTTDWGNYNITYHTTLEDSNPITGGVNPITPLNSYNATTGTTIYVRVEDVNDPACFLNRSFTLTVSALDDASFTYPEIQYCTSESNPTPTSTEPGGIYTVNNGGVLNSTTGEFDINSSGNGTDSSGLFTITYTTPDPCSSFSEFDITIVSLDEAGFTYPSIICFENEMNPTASSFSTGGTFTVNNGATINASTGELDLSSSTPGITYTITYEFNGDCPSSEEQTITVIESPIANNTIALNSCDNGDGSANFDVSSLSTVILGSQTNMTLTYHENQDDANDGVNALNTTPEVRATGDIYARVENVNGCFTTVVIPLIVDNCFIIIPDGFSPNSSNVDNQTFNIGNIKTMFPNYKIYIYNRLGNEVFSGDATKNDWNGKMNNEGELLPTGTYFYGIKLNDEQDLSYRGWVYLLQ